MKRGQTIRLLLADDHELFRDGLKTLLADHPEVEVAGEAKNGYDLVQLTKLLRPDVILTDIKMPGMSGIEATRIINKDYPFAVVVAFTTFSEDHFIRDMLDAGAKGYMLKGAKKKEIMEAIYRCAFRSAFFLPAYETKSCDY